MNGDSNYTVSTFGRGEKAYEVVVRRKDKPSEHDLRKQAEAELARLRPLAELYPLAWEECKWMRRNANMTQWVVAKVAHDKARAERGVGQ